MTDKADKILDNLRRSQNNCTRHDLEVIYEAYGFRIRKGNKHDIAIHTKYKRLRSTLPNHKPFLKAYVICAIKLIEESVRLRKEEEDKK
jgi:hypothetical protein